MLSYLNKPKLDSGFRTNLTVRTVLAVRKFTTFGVRKEFYVQEKL